jgi:hypothetical protein
MKYVEWVDLVLATLDNVATGDQHMALIGAAVWTIPQQMGLPADKDVDRAIRSAASDLELLGCAEADGGGHFVKVTQKGHQLARTGGLQTVWKDLFASVAPLAEDREVLAKIVELGVSEDDSFASAGLVELKETLELVGRPCDQGSAIATCKRLEEIGCVRSPVITTGWCQVVPSYIGVVLSTEQVATKQRALLDDLLDDWETTNVDFKVTLNLGVDREKAEFCKDVLALANTRVSGARYLVLGFADHARAFTASVDPKCDAHRMESVLAAYCQPVPRIRYSLVELDGGTAGIIEVFSDRADLPYMLSRDIGKYKKDSVFVRHNTLTAVAEGEELDALVAEGSRARGDGF